MQDNKQKNQNEESLFTQMFGLESEQPTELELLNKPPVSSSESEQTSVPSAPNSTEANPFEISNPKDSEPNQELNLSSPETEPSPPEEIIELSTKKLPPLEDENVENSFVNTQAPKITPSSFSNENNLNSLNQLNNLTSSNKTEQSPQNNSYTSFQNDLNFSYQESSNELSSQSNNNGGNPTLAIILVIILAIGLGFLSLQVMNNLKSDKEDYVNNNNNANTTTPPTSENPNEEEPTPESEKIIINFDETLSFDNGVVDIANEVNQTTPYKPTATTGVIKCSTKKSITQSNYYYDAKMYLQYEDYKLKKVLQVTESYFSSATAYEQNLLGLETVEASLGDRESLRMTHSKNDNNKKITFNILYNLVYGNKYTDPNQTIMFVSHFEYDDDIESAMAAVIYNQNFLNLFQCSSVKIS